jgi:hypothetical protein
MSHVVGLRGLTGDLRNPLKACYALVEPTNGQTCVRLGR